MNYRHLSLVCHCGAIPDRISEVGFSDDHHLVIHWWCTACKKLVYVTKSLTDCWRDCPSSEQSLDVVLPKLNLDTVQDEDAVFLRSIGVQV